MAIDPFADEGDPLDANQDVGSQQNYIHIRIQQRNGRKTLTTLQGLPKGEGLVRTLSCHRPPLIVYVTAVQSMMLRSC